MALTFEMLKINHYTIWSLLPLGTIGVDINKAMYIKETDQEFIKKIRDPLSMAWRERYFKSLRAPVA
jgi:hypothetical protein